MHEDRLLPGDSMKVTIELGEAKWHGYVTETLWAIAAAPDRYRLDNIPFYAVGFSYGDEVVASPDAHGQLVVRGVLQRGGHSTYRIFVANGSGNPLANRYWNKLQLLGCSYERATDQLYAVDIPPEADIHEAYAVLERGKKKGVWDFEEGHCGHALGSSDSGE